MLIAAALYAGSTHELSIWSVFVAGVLGGVIGNFIAFWVGREFGYRLLLRYGRYVHLSESRIKIGQYLFMRHGSKVVFFARFVPLLRSVVGFLAGANYMPWRDFWIANIAGAIAWVAIDAFGAYYLGAEIKRLAAPAGVAIGIMVLAIIVFIAVVLARHEKRLASKPNARSLVRCGRFGPDAENKWFAPTAHRSRFSCLAAIRPAGPRC